VERRVIAAAFELLSVTLLLAGVTTRTVVHQRESACRLLVVIFGWWVPYGGAATRVPPIRDPATVIEGRAAYD
jgi:hypothetical protein